MISLDQLREAIDPATGRLCFTVPLATLPDTVTPYELHAFYASPAQPEILDWNSSEPTGVLGLGWRLPVLRIFAAGDHAYFLDEDGPIPLVQLDILPDGTETYGRLDGAFWKIRFQRSLDRWLLIDENGIRFHLGNWLSTDAVDPGTVWRLARIQDLWGNSTEFSYEQSRVQIIKGATDARLVLSYADKDDGECPPTRRGRFLQQIASLSPSGARLGTICFSYKTFGTGRHTKRILTDILAVPRWGRVHPSLSFAWTDGHITRIKTPEGGVGLVEYQNQTPAFSNRTVTLQPPAAGASLINSALSFATDYAVAAWRARADKSHLIVSVYGWDGRWVSSALASMPASAQSVVEVATSDESFAVRVDTALMPYRRDPVMAGKWTGPSAPLVIDMLGGENVVTACTDGAVGVLGRASLKLSAAFWDGSAWVTRATETLTGATQGAVVALGANAHRMVAAVADGTNGNAPVSVHLMGVNSLRQWQASGVSLPASGLKIDSLSVQVGTAFAVIRSTAWAAGRCVIDFQVVSWTSQDGSTQTQRLQEYACDLGETLPTATLCGSNITIGSKVFRFDGQKWSSQSEEWAAVLGVSLPAGSYTAQPAVTPREECNFVVLTQKSGSAALYRRLPDESWARIFDVPDDLTPDECSSIQVGGERYLAYQKGTTVVARPLAGDQVLADGMQVLSAQRLRLSGSRFFATYAGTWDDNPAIALHWATRSGVDGMQALPAVSKVRLLSGNTDDASIGYAAVDYIPTYEARSAVANRAGTFACFNRTSIAKTSIPSKGGAVRTAGSVQTEMYNGLTDAEAALLSSDVKPGYPQGDMTNATHFTRLLSGTAYRSTQRWKDKEGLDQSIVATTYTTVHKRQLCDGTGPVGFCARPMQSESVMDGVATTITTTYNDYLLPRAISSARFDADGNIEQVVTSQVYFPERYAQRGPENLLTPVIETLKTTNGVAVDARVTTWRDFSGTSEVRWGPDATLVANKADFAAFDAWTRGDAPRGWIAVESILDRNTKGATSLSHDVLGRRVCTLFDKDDARVVATFGNASPAQVSYYGFEPYERGEGWIHSGASIESLLDDTRFHTGSRSLQLMPDGSGQQGLDAKFSELEGHDAYLFSCWMGIPAGFAPDPVNSWWLEVFSGHGSNPIHVIPLRFPAPSDDWQYVQAVVPLAQIRQETNIAADTVLTVSIHARNTRGSVIVNVDELCFRPLDSTFSATVFDTQTGRAVAELGANGATRRSLYNGGGRLCARVGPDNSSIESISLLAYSRAMSADDEFQPAFPNQIIALTAASPGLFQEFAASDKRRWMLPTDWTIGGRQLRFGATSTDAIGSRAELTGFSHSNYAALVRVPSADCEGATVSLGTGDIFVSWIPGQTNGQWILQQQQPGSGSWQSIGQVPGPFAELWLFAIIDGVVFFFADGMQLFTWTAVGTSLGKLQLAATRPAAFENLLVAVEPSLTLTFVDGENEKLATVALAGKETAVISGRLFDVFGRPAYESKPLQGSLAIAAPTVPGASSQANCGMNACAPATYLPARADGKPMSLDEYINPAISGAPYVQTVFEDSPLGRPVEIGAPGARLAIGSGRTTRILYGPSDSAGWLGRVVAAGAPGLATGSYQRCTVVSPDGSRTETIVNQAKQLVARARFAANAGNDAAVAIESFAYDGAGRQVLHKQPNFYSPPPGSVADTWKASATYDFVGNLTSSSNPDEGVTRYLSDRAGRPRFVMNAAAALLSPPVISYVRYDSLDRPVERGVVSAMTLSWNDLATHVDNQSWPSVADGAVWKRRYVYDRPAGARLQDPQPAYLAGQLAQLQVNSDVYTYAYDLNGHVIQEDSCIAAFDNTVRQTQFGWDALQRLTAISYPRPLDAAGQPEGTPTRVSYTYDRLGRIAAIGAALKGDELLDPLNPNPGPLARYAWYRYGASGPPGSVTHGSLTKRPIKRIATFDDSGRVTAVEGDYFSQSMTYGDDGGVVMATETSRYAALPGSVDDLASSMLGTRAWRYDYDVMGRLTAAVASDAHVDSSLTAGTPDAPISYDANGAMLNVPRAASIETYSYEIGATHPRANSRVVELAVDIDIALDFTKSLPDGWSAGASNHGTSTSGSVMQGEGAPYFRLRGGSVGHYEYLQFLGVLGQLDRYTLTITWRAVGAFATQSGFASCDLVLIPAQGLPYRVPLHDFSAGAASWQTISIPIDMRAATAAASLEGAIVSIMLQIRNAKRGVKGAAGESLDIRSLTLQRSANTPTGNRYDAAGRVTCMPSRRISAIEYDAASDRVVRLAFEKGNAVASVGLTRGVSDAVVHRLITYADGTTLKVLEMRAPNGALLATETLDANGKRTRVSYLRDSDRAFGILQDNSELYLIRDLRGSVRAVVAPDDESGSALRQRIDYGPFGQMILCSGTSPTEERFAGHPVGEDLGDFSARLYDARLRTFLQPDRAHQSHNPYSYAGGDPVNFIDPSGNWAIPAQVGIGVGAILHGYKIYGLYQSGFFSYAWNNGWSAAADVLEVIGAAAVGGAGLYLASPVLGPLLWGYAAFAHLLVPTWVPVVSLSAQVAGGMYSAGVYGAVRATSEYFARGRRESLTPYDVASAGLSSAGAAFASSLTDALYDHFIAPPYCFPYFDSRGRLRLLRGTRGGAGWKQVGGGQWLFRRSSGIYAFEEFAVGGGYMPPFLQRGNADMTWDTNLALLSSRPYQFFSEGWRYGRQSYRNSGLVLEHRPSSFYLWVAHSIHTPGRGGPSHQGISAFIDHGVRYPWLIANELPQTIDMLARQQWTESAVTQ